MHTLIVGGGLCGLAIAETLERRGQDYTLLEARTRFGGRIKTDNSGDGAFDLGPAWFWPGQPRLEALIVRMGLAKFDQFVDGDLVFEDNTGNVQRHPSMRQPKAWRLVGGLKTLTDALAAKIPERRRHLDASVTSIENTGNAVIATLANGGRFLGDRIVIAMPPRLAAKIEFTPHLPEQALYAMRNIPTWMAGQAKAVAIYDSAFWRDQGLSGNALSHRGPLVEFHDASSESGPPYALFGFIGVPPAGRKDRHRLRLDIQNQLERLFGPQAANPKRIILQDWAFDPHTAVEQDQSPQFGHPNYGLPLSLTDIWDGKLHFSGTELASVFGGYLEGALQASERVLANMPSN